MTTDPRRHGWSPPRTVLYVDGQLVLSAPVILSGPHRAIILSAAPARYLSPN